MNIRRPIGFCLSMFAALAFSGCTHVPATQEQAAEPSVSTDSRAHMALAHEKAAGCLRAGHPMGECHQAAMQAMEGHMNHGMNKGMGMKMQKRMHGMMHDDGKCKMMGEKETAKEQAPDAHNH